MVVWHHGQIIWFQGVLCVDHSGHYAIKCKFGGAIVCVSQYSNHVDFTRMSADVDHGPGRLDHDHLHQALFQKSIGMW